MDYIEKIAGLANGGGEAYRFGYLARLAAEGVRPGLLEKSADDKGKEKGTGKSPGFSPVKKVKGVPGALLNAGRGVLGFGTGVARDVAAEFGESAGKTLYDLRGMELDALRAEYLREALRLRRAARVASMPDAGSNSVRMRL